MQFFSLSSFSCVYISKQYVVVDHCRKLKLCQTFVHICLRKSTFLYWQLMEPNLLLCFTYSDNNTKKVVWNLTGPKYPLYMQLNGAKMFKHNHRLYPDKFS